MSHVYQFVHVGKFLGVFQTHKSFSMKPCPITPPPRMPVITWIMTFFGGESLYLPRLHVLGRDFDG